MRPPSGEGRVRDRNGSGFPDQAASTLRLSNAGLPCHEKSFIFASRRRSLQLQDVLAATRRLFGLRGGGSRQDALSTEEAAEPRASDEDSDASAAWSKRKKGGRVRKRRTGSPYVAGIKRKGAGKHGMALIAKRDCVIGAIGVIVGITSCLDARGAIGVIVVIGAIGVKWVSPRDSGYTPREDGSSFPQRRDRVLRPSSPSISLKTPVLPQKAEHTGDG